MRLRLAFRLTTLAGTSMLLASGCGSEDVSVMPVTSEVKATPPVAADQLKGDAKKAVGPGSSANIGKLKRNPMDGTK